MLCANFIFERNGTVVQSFNIHSDENYVTENCGPNQKFAVIVHGWTENCNTEWVPVMAKSRL